MPENNFVSSFNQANKQEAKVLLTHENQFLEIPITGIWEEVIWNLNFKDTDFEGICHKLKSRASKQKWKQKWIINI